MKYWGLITLSAVTFLAACDSGSSVTNPEGNIGTLSSSSSALISIENNVSSSSIILSNAVSSSSVLSSSSVSSSSVSSSSAIIEEASSSSVFELIKGNLQYERHFNREGVANMNCEVYASDHNVSMEMQFKALEKNSRLVQNTYIELDGNSTFFAEMNFEGLFSSAAENGCATLKQTAFQLDDGVVDCTDNGATLLGRLPEIHLTDKQYYINQTVAKLKSTCDEAYTRFNMVVDELVRNLEDVNKDINQKEKALFCDVSANGNETRMNVIYVDKSVNFSMTLQDDHGLIIREEYAGLDDSTLAQLCAHYKTEQEISNLHCADSVITYTSSELEFKEDMELYTTYLEHDMCPALLDGSMSLHDMLFGE